jgi:hypothetical protein
MFIVDEAVGHILRIPLVADPLNSRSIGLEFQNIPVCNASPFSDKFLLGLGALLARGENKSAKYSDKERAHRLDNLQSMGTAVVTSRAEQRFLGEIGR